MTTREHQNKTEAKPRTMEDNLREERQVNEALEELAIRKRKLQAFEDEVANLQGDSIQRLSRLQGPLTSPQDAAKQTEFLTAHREISFRLHSDIEGALDAVKAKERPLLERLDQLFHERLHLATITDTPRKDSSNG